MKRLLWILIFFPGFSVADEVNRFGLGLGLPYGGIGVKYTVNTEIGGFYGGVGLQGYAQYSGAYVGYAIGFDRVLGSSNKHTLGPMIWRSEAPKLDYETYNGVAVSYTYYFNEVHQKSWLIGTSLNYGERDVGDRDLDSTRVSIGFSAGYQF